MKIFTEIKDSIINKEFYKSLPAGRTLGSSIKYLAKLSLIIALISVVIFAFGIPAGKKIIKAGLSEIVANFPADLTLTIKDGTASINKPEPYFVPIAESLQEDLKSEEDSTYKDYKNFIVIDTAKPFSLEQFKAYASFVWITKTEVVGIKSNGEIQIVPISKTGNWEINKAWVLEKEALLLKILPWGILVFLLILFVALFGGNLIGTLFLLIFYAIAIWLMAKIKKVPLSYKDSYKIGIHGMTLPIILSMLGIIFSILDNFFFKLVLLLVIVYINFFQDSASKNEPMPVTSTPVSPTGATETSITPPTQM